MEITITNARQAPKWESLQELIRQVDRSSGKLTRISRVDGGCDYQAPGVYELDYRRGDVVIPIKLTVLSVGEPKFAAQTP